MKLLPINSSVTFHCSGIKSEFFIGLDLLSLLETLIVPNLHSFSFFELQIIIFIF
jgi:hypothetical protein